MRHFGTLVQARWDEGKFLCVGLDPDLEKVPEKFKTGSVSEILLAFNKYIVAETRDVAAAYKPNCGFYEAHGEDGWRALRETITYVQETAPGIPVILDAKRGDLENTNRGYAQGIFEALGADALTVNPYMGGEALAPFLERADKGIIVLCRNSNPGAKEFQDATVGDVPLYLHVARHVNEWNSNKNCWLVVGSTYPEEMKKVRELVPKLPFLVPGVGAQGGDLEASVKAARDAQGHGFIISTSRAIMYAESPRAEAQKMHSAIQKALLE